MPEDYLAALFGEWSREVNLGSTALKIALALIMGTILGCERARNRHAAGLRTFLVMSLGAVLAAVGDLYFVRSLDAGFSFLSAAVIVGISIISANTILFSSKNQLKGLTTSVGLWTMAIISVVLGLGLYLAAIIGFCALMVGLRAFDALEVYFKKRSLHFEIHLELKARNRLQEFIETVRQFGCKIDDIESNPAYANTGLGVYSVKLTASEELGKKKHSEIVEALAVLDCVSYVEEIS